MARMPTYNQFEFNNCNTICDRTGFKVKLHETRTEWEGYQVLRDEWEPRQPQDFQVTPRPPHVYDLARFEPADRDVNGNPVELCDPPFVGKPSI